MPTTTSQSFRKTEKLLNAADFKAVFRHGKRMHMQHLTIIKRKNRNKDLTRLGLAISRKNVRRAVDRNRIKRIIREWFRRNKVSLAGYDYVVMAKTSVSRSDSNTIMKQLLQVSENRVRV